jgi:trigger factor
VEVSVQEKNSYTRILNVSVEEAQITEKFEEVLKNYKKEVKVPGFRPGHVPRDMVIQRFGKVLREEAVEMMVSASFKDACEKEKITPISKPVIKKLEAPEGKPLTYEAELEIEPPVALAKYSGLGVKVEEKPVSDGDVMNVIKEVQERMATLKTVDRALKTGDYADLEYRKVIIGGEEKKDYHSPQYPVEIGSASALKDLENSLVGMKKGEEKTVNFNFPQDYNYKEVAGKKAEFTIFIKDVKEKELPVLDDAFATASSPRSKTMEDLKAVIRKDLEEDNRHSGLNKAHNDAIDKVIALNPFDVPESRIVSYLEYSFESFQKQYPSSKTTKEEFDQKNRDTVIRDLKRFKILELVSQKENLKASQDEVDDEIRKYAEGRNESFEKVKAALRKSGQIMDIRENLRERKALNFLIDLVEKKEEGEKKTKTEKKSEKA